MDIICAKCGKHFSDIDSAREHRGQCRENPNNSLIHWLPSQKSLVSPEEWERLVNAINQSSVSPSVPSGEKVKTEHKKKVSVTVNKWLIALLLIFATAIVGLGISIYTNTFLLFWLVLGFSIIFCVEKWFTYYTRKHKLIGKLYRIILNLFILALLGVLIWSGIQLFSKQFTHNTLAGSLVFIAEFIFFIWMWRVIARNSWRWPSMKLTIFSLIFISLVFAFAGVNPFSTYKDTFFSSCSSYWAEQKTNEEVSIPTNQSRVIQAEGELSQPVASIGKKVVDTKENKIFENVSESLQTIWNTSLDDYINQFNSYRQSKGLHPLVFAEDLNRMAQLRLQELYMNFSHYSPGNYNEHLAENIAMSTGLLNNSSALSMWQKSPGHNANMLDPSYKYSGYAIGNRYAIQLFTDLPTINGKPQLPPGWFWVD